MNDQKMELSDEYLRIYTILDTYKAMTIPKISVCREIMNDIQNLDFVGKLKPKMLENIRQLDNGCNQLYNEIVFISDKIRCLEELYRNLAYLQSKYQEHAELVRQYKALLELIEEENRKKRKIQMYEK